MLLCACTWTRARPIWSKFGFNADTNEWIQAVEHIHRSRALNLVGFHCHSGTFLLDPDIYHRVTHRLIERADQVRREYGFNVEYLNLGGGFPSQGYLNSRSSSDENTPSSIDDYAKAICDPIHDLWPKDRPLPRLYSESGRALVQDAGYLLTTIVAQKHGSGSADYLVDAGINLLPPSALCAFQIRPAQVLIGGVHKRSILGCLCMNTDVLGERVALPDMKIGTHLVFHPVGAYNITQSMQFITYRPQVVMVTQEGRVEIIREKENLAHVEVLERLPDGLGMPMMPLAKEVDTVIEGRAIPRTDS